MKNALIFFSLLVFTNSLSQNNDSGSTTWLTDLSNLSSYQENFPCNRLNNSLTWTNSLEDMKDILIIQLLIQEDRYEDLLSFFDERGYIGRDNIYTKGDNGDREEYEIMPVIVIEEKNIKDQDNLGLLILFQYKDSSGELIAEMNQSSTNAIYILLSSVLSKGQPYMLTVKAKEFYEEENEKLKADGLNPKWTIENFSNTSFNAVDIETKNIKEHKSSNTFGIGNNPSNQMFSYLYKENRMILLEYKSKSFKDDSSCISNDYSSVLLVSSIDEDEIKGPLNINLFKSLNGLNEIIWAAE